MDKRPMLYSMQNSTRHDSSTSCTKCHTATETHPGACDHVVDDFSSEIGVSPSLQTGAVTEFDSPSTSSSIVRNYPPAKNKASSAAALEMGAAFTGEQSPSSSKPATQHKSTRTIRRKPRTQAAGTKNTDANIEKPKKPGRNLKERNYNGVELFIGGGVFLEFPLRPYPVQLYMMNQVLRSVINAQNCLLESPTGTGKTLALLCSTLAWQKQEKGTLRQLEATAFDQNKDDSNGEVVPTPKHQKEKINPKTVLNPDSPITIYDSDEEVFQEPKRKKTSTSFGEHDKAADPPVAGQIKPGMPSSSQHKETPIEKLLEELDSNEEGIKAPKIFYGTRTHKQIEQVVDQLKKTKYAETVRMTILASRDHTCVNKSVCDKPNVTEACQALIDPVYGMGCTYYQGVSKGVTHENLECFGLPEVFDIEDMVSMGHQRRMCPYFTLKNLILSSDIVFCPYNYLIDPNIRASMNINLAKAILIMDEAHNIEEICREAGSLCLKQTALEVAIRDCKENIRRSTNTQEYITIEDYLQLLLDWLSTEGPNRHYFPANETFSSLSGSELVVQLQVYGVTEEKFEKFKGAVNKIGQDKQDNFEENSAMSGVCKQVCGAIRTSMGYLYKPQNMAKYQAFFGRDICSEDEYPKAGSWLSKHKTNSNSEDRVWKYTLRLLCMSPDIVFDELSVARTVILASGTLTPVDSFESELGVKFAFRVKGRHVVPAQNLFVSALSAGPQRVELKGVYENTNSYHYQDEVGRAILEISRTVPHGVLCFVGSYFVMEKLRERWSATGLIDQLGEVKHVFWEPRKRQDMVDVMVQYTERIGLSTKEPDKQIGAILFGVFRGKISEGVDFSDDYARVVIALGIPFLNKNTMEINLKMKFNDEFQKKYGLIKGKRWYISQAFRALNQALGRCIRHKEDWGAIILLDLRFSMKETTDNLPEWIKYRIQRFNTWEQHQSHLTQFCERMSTTQSCPSLAQPTVHDL